MIKNTVAYLQHVIDVEARLMPRWAGLYAAIAVGRP